MPCRPTGPAPTRSRSRSPPPRRWLVQHSGVARSCATHVDWGAPASRRAVPLVSALPPRRGSPGSCHARRDPRPRPLRPALPLSRTFHRLGCPVGLGRIRGRRRERCVRDSRAWRERLPQARSPRHASPEQLGEPPRRRRAWPRTPQQPPPLAPPPGTHRDPLLWVRVLRARAWWRRKQRCPRRAPRLAGGTAAAAAAPWRPPKARIFLRHRLPPRLPPSPQPRQFGRSSAPLGLNSASQRQAAWNPAQPASARLPRRRLKRQPRHHALLPQADLRQLVLWPRRRPQKQRRQRAPPACPGMPQTRPCHPSGSASVAPGTPRSGHRPACSPGPKPSPLWAWAACPRPLSHGPPPPERATHEWQTSPPRPSQGP
mmetsp:Transcript_9910/g.38561  ORF Transcript_9910/g.38561 Transcript_9910/m.38561 type:complete len:372 (-) Transcript_9910:753-1868(-)